MSGFTEGALPAALPKAAVMLNSATPVNEEEKTLARRFTNRWSGKQEDLVFEFTKDPALVHQYHRIYEEQFRAVHNATRYQHNEQDEHDSRGHIIVARRGNFCVGGARLSIKTPRLRHALPVEINGFRFEDHFPELGQKQMRYAQIGRFCLLPEFRGGNATQMLLWHLYRKSIALGMDVIFGTAPLLNARLYMKNFAAMGLKNAKLHTEVTLPDYPMCEEIKFYLISLTVDKELVAETQEKLALTETEEA